MRAIHSPNTGIVDWKRVACSYGDDFKAGGGTILTGYEVCWYFGDVQSSYLTVIAFSHSGRGMLLLS